MQNLKLKFKSLADPDSDVVINRIDHSLSILPNTHRSYHELSVLDTKVYSNITRHIETFCESNCNRL